MDENKDDLSKALDDSLQGMSDLVKSKSDASLRELCSSPTNRKALKKLMKEYAKKDSDEDEDNEPDNDEDDENKMKKGKKSEAETESHEGESDEDDDDEDEQMSNEDDEDDDSEKDEDDKKKKMPPFLKKKFKKSLDEAVEENQEVIDAVPVLKSFVEVILAQGEEISTLRKSISSMKDSFESVLELQKSFASVLEINSKLVKSFSDDVSSVAQKPEKVKGVRTQGDLLTKSFQGEDGQTKTFPVGLIRNALLKSFQDGQIDSKVISRWEMSNYRMDTLPASVISIVEKQISQEVKNNG